MRRIKNKEEEDANIRGDRSTLFDPTLPVFLIDAIFLVNYK
jgi:hypothetical protein